MCFCRRVCFAAVVRRCRQWLASIDICLCCFFWGLHDSPFIKTGFIVTVCPYPFFGLIPFHPNHPPVGYNLVGHAES